LLKVNDGLLPLQIQGPLQPGSIEIDGSLSSQFLTGLLFAFSAAKASGVTITVNNLNSKPYIDLTLQVMKDFGMAIPVNNNYQSFSFASVDTRQSTAKQLTYAVEGDWSGGAFLLVAGAIAGDILVKGLNVFSTQADKAILQAIMQSGANISIEENQIQVRKSRLKPFHFNATDCPDLFPPLVGPGCLLRWYYCDRRGTPPDPQGKQPGIDAAGGVCENGSGDNLPGRFDAHKGWRKADRRRGAFAPRSPHCHGLCRCCIGCRG
jgi:5-enolpyruvylshikimate-3-phosphate synthase